MRILHRLEEHLNRREWVHLEREASRLIKFEQLGPCETGRAYRAWGRALIGRNEYYGAAKLLEESLVHSLSAKDWDCLGAARADLGGTYIQIGDYSAAVNYLQSYLLDLRRYSEANGLLGKVRFNLGLAHKRRREYPKAIAEYGDALNWFALRGFVHEKAMVHQNVAWLMCTIGRPEEAKTHIEVADTYRDRLGPPFEAEQICGWAFYYWKSGQVGYAVDCVQEILLGNRAGVTPVHVGQAAIIGGHIATMLGRESSARQLVEVALQAALDSGQLALASDCSLLRVEIWRKWGGTSEAAI